MSNFAHIEKQKEIDRERRNNTNRTTGALFYSFSKLSFGALIVGVIASHGQSDYDIIVIMFGIFATVLFACIGYNLINRR